LTESISTVTIARRIGLLFDGKRVLGFLSSDQLDGLVLPSAPALKRRIFLNLVERTIELFEKPAPLAEVFDRQIGR
jgi:hypothetical protein